MRYLMIVQYNGLNYNGFQKQNNGNTIQNHLENALKTVLKEDIVCIGSGRTDAKVSAYFQPVHFDCTKAINTEKTLYSLNGILPNNIKILSLIETNLHARFDAKKKTYVYKMYVSNMELPLYDKALRIPTNYNFKAMKKFIKMLGGTHNFEGFKASGSEVENNIRIIYNTKLKREGNYLNFYITGNGFLYKMVRNIVGTMLKIGEGKINLKELKNTLFSTYKATNTAKPEFLYLYNVAY